MASNNTIGQQGILRVVSPQGLTAAVAASAKAVAESQKTKELEGGLSSFIRTQFDLFRRHRDMALEGWSERLLNALRIFNGQYSSTQLSEIQKFGGSQVYARLIAMKCRGATSLLRDVYLGPDRPWGLDSPPDPPIPPEIMQAIQDLVVSEVQSQTAAARQPPAPPTPAAPPAPGGGAGGSGGQSGQWPAAGDQGSTLQLGPSGQPPNSDVTQMQGGGTALQGGAPSAPPTQPGAPPTAGSPQAGAPPGPVQPPPPPPQPPNVDQIRDRVTSLVEAARQAAKKKAADQAEDAEDKVDELLVEGGFYKALAEFLVDLPLFPFACIKGPTVRVKPQVTWVDGRPVTENKPKLTWDRVSPFDLWWTPGVHDIEDAAVIERSRITRAELNDLIGLPGYDQQAIRGVLEDYGRGGLVDNWDLTDTERAIGEHRENPWYNRSGLISCLGYHGNVQGIVLLQQGFDPALIPDPLRDYFIDAWMIGRYIIKAQLSPSPRRRHPYYITSFEKVPGTVIGNALPDLLEDIQDVANATLRALVNNLSISSGPQVVVNTDRLAPDEDAESLYPWKRWHMLSDPMGNTTEKPVDFFQPQSNAQELIMVYRTFSDIADDISAIPKYMAGDNAGAAGRTASGLAMLMGNASKILQTVAANIDRDVMEGVLQGLRDMILLTDTSGLLTGEEIVKVMGVTVALQKETQRSRQMEFLQATANPIDMAIIGPRGRANVLRPVAQTLGLDGSKIVPTDDELEAQQKQAKILAQQQQIPGHAQNQPDQPNQGAQAQGGQQPAVGTANPRVNLMQNRPQAAVAGGVR
jgi:hypothetical protein